MSRIKIYRAPAGALAIALSALALAAVALTVQPVTRAGETSNRDPLPTVEVYQSPTCGCCTLWVDHLRDEGFTVNAHMVDDRRLTQIKIDAGLTRELASCHTGIVDGYVVEGHVPAEDVARMLRERPDIAGIAVPGMPIGSPGMEVGDRRDPYDVLAFDRDGNVTVYASHHRD